MSVRPSSRSASGGEPSGVADQVQHAAGRRDHASGGVMVLGGWCGGLIEGQESDAAGERLTPRGGGGIAQVG